MTIREQAKLILAAIHGWSKANHGRAWIAADVVECIDELRARPGTINCAVLWTGRQPMGEVDRIGKKLNEFKVVVSRGKSLKIVPGESMTDGAAGGAAMFDLVEQCEAIVLGVRQPVDEGQDPEDAVPVHLGTGMFEVNGLILDAMEIRLSLAAQGPPQDIPIADDSDESAAT